MLPSCGPPLACSLPAHPPTPIPLLWPSSHCGPPLQAAQFSFFNRGTNKQNAPGVMRPPLGWESERSRGVLTRDWPLLREKGKIWWSGLSRPPLIEWKKVTRQNPDQWLGRWDNHLSGHCAPSGDLDLTKLSHTMNRAGHGGCVRGVTWPADTRGCRAAVALISSYDHSGPRRIKSAARSRLNEALRAEPSLGNSCIKI